MVPMQVPTFYRRWLVAGGADDDWALTQVLPPSNLLVPLSSLAKVLCVNFVPYTAGVVDTGTLDLQCVVADNSAPYQGQPPVSVIMGSSVQTAVAVGQGAVFDVSGCRRIAIRIAGSATTAVYVDLFLRILED